MSYTQLPSYNGYTNFFTWNIGMHIDNDQGLINEVIPAICEECEYHYLRVADRLKEWSEQLVHEVLGDDAFFIHDVMGYSLAYVNWDELAKHYVDCHIPDHVRSTLFIGNVLLAPSNELDPEKRKRVFDALYDYGQIDSTGFAEDSYWVGPNGDHLIDPDEDLHSEEIQIENKRHIVNRLYKELVRNSDFKKYDILG